MSDGIEGQIYSEYCIVHRMADTRARVLAPDRDLEITMQTEAICEPMRNEMLGLALRSSERVTYEIS